MIGHLRGRFLSGDPIPSVNEIGSFNRLPVMELGALAQPKGPLVAGFVRAPSGSGGRLQFQSLGIVIDETVKDRLDDLHPLALHRVGGIDGSRLTEKVVKDTAGLSSRDRLGFLTGQVATG